MAYNKVMNAKDLLAKLISFNTINDKENGAILDFIEKYLSGFGFHTEYRSKCLVMSIGEEQPIGFLGHTDTVSASNNWKTNPFELTEKDGRLFGLGTCDMKGGIAAMLAVVSQVDWSKCPGMKMYFTFDEETDFGGILELLDKNISFPDKMIIGEPTDNEVINSSKGLVTAKVYFTGKTAHASTPEKGVNAIHNCAEFIYRLREIMGVETATMNVGVISGGRAINIVPEHCEIGIDFRTDKPEQNKVIERALSYFSPLYGAKYEITSNLLPFMAKKDVKMCDFITEASFLSSKERIILGVGPVNPHADNEYIEAESLKKLESQYLELISSC